MVLIHFMIQFCRIYRDCFQPSNYKGASKSVLTYLTLFDRFIIPFYFIIQFDLVLLRNLRLHKLYVLYL